MRTLVDNVHNLSHLRSIKGEIWTHRMQVRAHNCKQQREQGCIWALDKAEPGHLFLLGFCFLCGLISLILPVSHLLPSRKEYSCHLLSSAT